MKIRVFVYTNCPSIIPSYCKHEPNTGFDIDWLWWTFRYIK